MSSKLEAQMQATYLSLRVTLAVLAFLLPPLLWAGGRIAGIPLRNCMSAYYWATPTRLCPCGAALNGDCIKQSTTTEIAPIHLADKPDRPAGTMRNYFVGLLFAVGTALFVYKGYTRRENRSLNFAGTMAVAIALVPMPWDCAKHVLSLHGAFAILFFLAIAYDCAFCSEDTLGLIVDPVRRAKYRRLYRTLGTIMVLSPFTAYAFTILTDQKGSYIYWAEFFGIYAFAIYWTAKIFEISRIRFDRRALGRETDALVV